MAPEKRWTDDRLGDLDKTVDVGFAQIGKEFEKVDLRFAQVGKEFKKVDERFDKVDARFDAIDKRFGELDRTLLGAAVALIITLIGCCATLIGVAAL